MQVSLNEALDNSLALLKTGHDGIEECLSHYPEHADNLRPLLALALDVSRLPTPKASAATFADGKHRMLAAVARKKQQKPSAVRRYASKIGNLLRGRLQPTVQWRATALRWVIPATLALALLVAVGILSVQPSPETATPQAAALDQASGTVTIQSSDGESRRPTPVGAQVKAGDQIRTGPLNGSKGF